MPHEGQQRTSDIARKRANKTLVEYADKLPVPDGFESYDGYDDETQSRAYFRSKGGYWDQDEVWHGKEIVVTVTIINR